MARRQSTPSNSLYIYTVDVKPFHCHFGQVAGLAVGEIFIHTATANPRSTSATVITATAMATVMSITMATRARMREVVTRGRSTGNYSESPQSLVNLWSRI